MQKHRTTWGSSGLLAVTQVSGVCMLVHGIHVTRVEVELVPMRSWEVGSRTLVSCGEANRPFVEARTVRLLFVNVRVR
jgi:hypothetical protein